MDINNMIAIVQLYIGMRKGKDVNISIRDTRDLMLLSKAYQVANNWMVNNNVTVTQA